MVRDDALRQQLYSDNNLEPVFEIDIAATLKILETTKRKRADISNYGFDEDSGMVVKKPQVIDADQAYKADQEIANSFTIISDDDNDEMASMLSDVLSDDGYDDDDPYLENDIEPDLYHDDDGYEIPPEYE